jgi:hypothetical protein
VTNETVDVFYIVPEGAVAEEATPRSWADLVAMCQSGKLSSRSLILFPDGQYVKASETDLFAAAGDRPDAEGTPRPAPTTASESARTEYECLKGELEGGDGDWNRRVQLAEMALEFGDRAAAVKHFQEALDGNHYHPRIRSTANRCLSRAELRTLRYLSKPKPIWDDFGGIVLYPLSRGPLYVAIPTAVIWGLLWVPVVKVMVPLLLFLWAVEVARATAGGRDTAPLWHGALERPIDTVLKPLGVAVVVAAELYLPFIVIAGILALSDPRHSTIAAVIADSPPMVVIMAMLTLLYVPAVLVVAAASNCNIRHVADPRNVIVAVIKMEGEYITSIAILAALGAAWTVLAFVFEMIPFVGKVLVVGSGVYALVAGAVVVGRLQARFQSDAS